MKKTVLMKTVTEYYLKKMRLVSIKTVTEYHLKKMRLIPIKTVTECHLKKMKLVRAVQFYLRGYAMTPYCTRPV